MTSKDLFVILKPNECVDSMGGDLPWQSYTYWGGINAEGHGIFTSDVQEAAIFTSKEEAEKAMPDVCRFSWAQRSPYYRIKTLFDGIKHGLSYAYDMGAEGQ